MRISDWSSDVCSSDLNLRKPASTSTTRGSETMPIWRSRSIISRRLAVERDDARAAETKIVLQGEERALDLPRVGGAAEYGRASRRGRVCQTCRVRCAQDRVKNTEQMITTNKE